MNSIYLRSFNNDVTIDNYYLIIIKKCSDQWSREAESYLWLMPFLFYLIKSSNDKVSRKNIYELDVCELIWLKTVPSDLFICSCCYPLFNHETDIVTCDGRVVRIISPISWGYFNHTSRT
jgi:hypothetical protein